MDNFNKLKNGLCSSVLLKSSEEAHRFVCKLERSGIKASTQISSEGIYVKISRERIDRDLWLPEEHVLPVVYVVNKPYIGDEKKLGGILLESFFHNMLSTELKPQYIIFMGSGVLLTTEGSKIINLLSALETEGVNPLVCGTSLDYYELRQKLRVGRITGINEINNLFENMKKIITL